MAAGKTLPVSHSNGIDRQASLRALLGEPSVLTVILTTGDGKFKRTLSSGGLTEQLCRPSALTFSDPIHSVFSECQSFQSSRSQSEFGGSPAPAGQEWLKNHCR